MPYVFFIELAISRFEGEHVVLVQRVIPSVLHYLILLYNCRALTHDNRLGAFGYHFPVVAHDRFNGVGNNAIAEFINATCVTIGRRNEISYASVWRIDP